MDNARSLLNETGRFNWIQRFGSKKGNGDELPFKETNIDPRRKEITKGGAGWSEVRVKLRAFLAQGAFAGSVQSRPLQTEDALLLPWSYLAVGRELFPCLLNECNQRCRHSTSIQCETASDRVGPNYTSLQAPVNDCFQTRGDCSKGIKLSRDQGFTQDFDHLQHHHHCVRLKLFSINWQVDFEMRTRVTQSVATTEVDDDGR